MTYIAKCDYRKKMLSHYNKIPFEPQMALDTCKM